MKDEWWFPFFDDKAEYDLNLSGKLTFLKTLLEECEQIGDKVLLFSRSLFSLSYLEQFLKYWDSMASGKKIQVDDFDAKVKANGRWKFGIDYFRIDGLFKRISFSNNSFVVLLQVVQILVHERLTSANSMIQQIFVHVCSLFRPWQVELELI